VTKNTILLALLIRLLIIPFFYHPDIKSTLFHTQYLQFGVGDIYSFVEQNKSQLPYNNIFVYLPFTYFFLGFINILLSPLYPSAFSSWITDWGFFQNNNPNLPFILLILKLPYLIFDFGTGWLIYRLTQNKRYLNFWLFNPISLYLIYIQGNFDIIPTFFTLACLYFLSVKKDYLGYLSLGIGIALKIYPILFLPFILLKYSPSLKKIIISTIITFIPLILSLIPYIFQANFYSSFIGSGLTQKLLENKLFNIPVFPLLYLIILFIFYLSKTKNLDRQLLLLFFIFVSTVNFHPQWLIWFLPFIIPYFYSKSKYLLVFVFVFSLLYVFLINDNFLFWAHLTPVDWEFTRATSPYNLILLKTPLHPDVLRSVAKTLISLFCLFFLFYEKKSTSNHR